MSREDDTSWLSPMLRMRQIRICYPPNGRRLVYSGLADLDDNGDYHSDIYTINAVGEVRPKLPTPTTRAKSILPGEPPVAASRASEASSPGLGEGLV
jgi:hypothetical protein